MRKPKLFKSILLLFCLSINNVFAAQLSLDLIPGGAIDNTFSATIDNKFNIEIVINEVSDFAGFELDLGFDNNALTATSVTSGNIFGSDTFLIDDAITLSNMSFAEASLASNGLDINSPIVIATISFDAIAVGTSRLNLTDVVLSNSLGIEISPVNLTEGDIAVSGSVVIPVPAAFWLFFSGVLWFFKMGRRKVNKV